MKKLKARAPEKSLLLKHKTDQNQLDRQMIFDLARTILNSLNKEIELKKYDPAALDFLNSVRREYKIFEQKTLRIYEDKNISALVEDLSAIYKEVLEGRVTIKDGNSKIKDFYENPNAFYGFEPNSDDIKNLYVKDYEVPLEPGIRGAPAFAKIKVARVIGVSPETIRNICKRVASKKLPQGIEGIHFFMENGFIAKMEKYLGEIANPAKK